MKYNFKLAAMFGLDSSLQNSIMLNLFQYLGFCRIKKAAMFGLDARIALAIFGALSIITGAALYSALQKAEMVKIISIKSEVSKAIQAYILDTMKDIPKDDVFYTNYGALAIENLIENKKSIDGWRGSYLNLPIETTTRIKNGDYANGAFKVDYIKSWEVPGSTSKCSSKESCYYAVEVRFPTEDIALKIDKEIDSGDGKSLGNVRFTPNTAGSTKYHIYFITDIPAFSL